MDILIKHGLNDQNDIPNFLSNNKDSANQLFQELKPSPLPHEKYEEQIAQ